MNEKDYTKATKLKRQIEDSQRKLRAQRTSPYESEFFTFKQPLKEDVGLGHVFTPGLSMELGKPYLKDWSWVNRI
jgi:hypothetical protein